MNNFDTFYDMRRKLTNRVTAIMGILHCEKQLGNDKNSHVYEYLKTYPNLSELPYHESKYIGDLLQKNKDVEIHQTILNALDDLSSGLPKDNEIVTQLDEYKKYPWKASIKDLLSISEIFAKMAESGDLPKPIRN